MQVKFFAYRKKGKRIVNPKRNIGHLVMPPSTWVFDRTELDRPVRSLHISALRDDTNKQKVIFELLNPILQYISKDGIMIVGTQLEYNSKGKFVGEFFQELFIKPVSQHEQ